MNEKEIQLLRELQKENVWWQDNEVPAKLTMEFKRSDYFTYRNLLENDKINVIIGPRRVGKSTVMYQLINYLIKERLEKINPKRIIFLSLERAFFEVLTSNPITDSIKIYEENILKESISQTKESVYLFIDEASRNDKWAVTLKQFIDLKYNIKCFVSGSSSPALYQRSSESLVGRKNDILMLPLKFRDVLRFKNPKAERGLQSLGYKLRMDLLDSIIQKDPSRLFESIKSFYISIKPETETIMQIVLNDYLLRGGYPEFYDKKISWEESSKTMREAYFETIISYDFLKVFGSRNPNKIKKLYLILAMSTSNIISMSSIGRDIGDISRTALDDYFKQLQETHLINVSNIFKKNKRKIGNELKKAYVHDVGMRNAVLGLSENDIRQTEVLGALAETVTQDHIRRLKFGLEKEKTNELFFWRDNLNNELDFILEIKDQVIPIEVKYQESIKGNDLKVLRNAITKFDSPLGILITKKSIDLNEKIISIPLWLFLLLC